MGRRWVCLCARSSVSSDLGVALQVNAACVLRAGFPQKGQSLEALEGDIKQFCGKKLAAFKVRP